MDQAPESTCFEFALPYLLHGLDGSISFRFEGRDCRVELKRHKRPPGNQVSIVDDPFGRTDVSVLRICFRPPFALRVEELVDGQRQELVKRFAHLADREMSRGVHGLLIAAVNELVDGYVHGWAAWRLPSVQLMDLTGYSAFQLEGERPGGRIVRSLYPDPDSQLIESVRQALAKHDPATAFREFLAARPEEKAFYRFEMNAARAFFRKDTAVAVVTSVSAIEVYVNARLRCWAARESVPVDKLTRILKSPSKRKSHASAIGFAKLREKLSKGIRAATNLDLTGLPEWPKWTDVMEARHRAVHAGEIPSVQTAADCLTVARALFVAMKDAHLRSGR